MSMLFQPHDKDPKDQHTNEDIKQYPDVDQHWHFTSDGQRKEQDSILDHEKSNEMRKDPPV